MSSRSCSIALLLATAVAASGAVGASAAPVRVAAPATAKVSAARLAKVKAGTGLKWTGHGVSAQSAIDAAPTGGKGSGSEAVCANWGVMLQDDESRAENAGSQSEFNKAVNDLAADANSALDAGCMVIY